MGKKEKSIVFQRIVQSYLSSVISITLVLFLVGASAFLGINAQKFVRFFKENTILSIVLRDGITEEDALSAVRTIQSLPYISEAKYISQEQGTREMAELLGEDFLSQFDFNPVPVSVEVKLLAKYITTEEIDVVEKELSAIKDVREVYYQKLIIDTISKNLEMIGLGILIFISLLLFVSFVLINNTVRLSVYARRFTIHTMRLVGATRGFIRRPFMIRAIFHGLISSLLAVLMLIGLFSLAYNEFAEIYQLFDEELLILLFGSMVLTGAGICLISTYFAINKIVKINTEALYY
ncbi:MAG: permease-like cell division protein FtsX [Prevotellaceae bacterium]|jgi:cell division transport system permease protein|nr:permease-like cell division protein FtsX [Prevotellaceae bacterium]